MNVSRKAASLYQTMDLWIALYRRIHECDHNTAHDAFDEWADALKGESADQGTSQFHDAVHASYEAMLATAPKEEVPLVRRNKVVDSVGFGDHRVITASIGERTEVAGVSFRPVTFTATGEESLNTRRDVLLDPAPAYVSPRPTVDMSVGGIPGLPVRKLVGGPILETGHDPLSFKDSYKEENVHWGQKTTYHETDVSVLEERVVKELLGYGNPMPKIDTVDEARKKAEGAIELNTSFLINTKHTHDHPSVVKAREVIAAARTFLVMLGGVEERTEQRKSTGRLSLPKKGE